MRWLGRHLTINDSGVVMINGPLRYVHKVVDRLTGKERFYLRIRGRYWPIQGIPASSEFLCSYFALMKLHLQEYPRLTKKLVPQDRDFKTGTIGWVIADYLGSPHFYELSDQTKQVYRRALEDMGSSMGRRMMARLSDASRDQARPQRGSSRQTGEWRIKET
jgi:hypothetical protein